MMNRGTALTDNKRCVRMFAARRPDLDGITGTYVFMKRFHQRHLELLVIIGMDADGEGVHSGRFFWSERSDY